MKKLLLISALALLLANQAAAGDRHFLWRISKGDDSLYLMGSVHVMRADDYPLPTEMEANFKASNGLVEEVDLGQLDRESLQQIQERGAYPPGQSLKTALPADLYAKVSRAAQKQGLDMARLQTMRPWMVSIALLEQQLAQAGFDPQNGVDLHFAREAAEQQKPITGLESAEYQIGLMADLSESEQQDLLRQAVDETSNFDGEMNQLLDAWRTGNTAALEKVLGQDFGAYPSIYQSLVAARNKTWVPKLEALMTGGKHYFVVVGALHLVGPDGLLVRFEKDGYRVEQF